MDSYTIIFFLYTNFEVLNLHFRLPNGIPVLIQYVNFDILIIQMIVK